MKRRQGGKTPALDGDDFEARSALLLQRYGLKIIRTQYRCKAGEIDLIAYDEHRLLFVEVRARRHHSHGGAAASVNRAKQCRITRCAAYFLNRHPQWRHLPCRFDVIAWEPGPSHTLEARWIQAAFLS
ncbi:MAG: YraN family protein [Congregibacter sp.]|nr:YraN family protein [Congregibacter sp.]MDP5070981.1 YraN family protein [Congregibacter sp.]